MGDEDDRSRAVIDIALGAQLSSAGSALTSDDEPSEPLGTAKITATVVPQ
jgi:hypothetical protein